MFDCEIPRCTRVRIVNILLTASICRAEKKKYVRRESPEIGIPVFGCKLCALDCSNNVRRVKERWTSQQARRKTGRRTAFTSRYSDAFFDANSRQKHIKTSVKTFRNGPAIRRVDVTKLRANETANYTSNAKSSRITSPNAAETFLKASLNSIRGTRM